MATSDGGGNGNTPDPKPTPTPTPTPTPVSTHTNYWNPDAPPPIVKGGALRTTILVIGWFSLVAGFLLMIKNFNLWSELKQSYATREVASYYALTGWAFLFSGITSWVICSLLAAMHSNQELIMRKLIDDE